ncbi:MAG: heparan-alpha-glucosaminide N-acetyltransferase domain-containing protein [Bryobacteraceae bacterium]
MSSTVKPASSRLAFVDWTRGIAAFIMLQGHVFHSFTRPELRDRGPYVLSQFVGGIPPAVFLFLTGLTLAFRIDSAEKKGLPALQRVWWSMRRAGYLFGIAYLFRLQLWVFGLPDSPWTDLFRVDILNCMGLSVALISTMAVFRSKDRARLAAVLGLCIAAASPLVSQFNWTGVPALVKHYLAPDYLFFGFFPWASFLAFGLSAGTVVRVLRADQMDRAMQWTAILGFGLVFGGQYFSNVPYSVYTSADYWLNSPLLILVKLGVILLLLAFAYLWTQYAAGPGWSWVRQFGTTSLLVYWVHIELVYGRWLSFWKESLTEGQVILAAAGVILLMLGLSVARTNWRQWREAGFSPFGYFYPALRRASGD